MPRWDAFLRRSLEFAAVVVEIPLFWVPDLKTVPWLPHSDDASGRGVDPDVVGSLDPVVDFHSLLDELDEQVLSSDEADVSAVWVHEVVVERVDVDAESFSWGSADALVDAESEIVDDPHVSLDVGDGGCSVGWESLNVQMHLESVVRPVVDEGSLLSLVAVILGGVGSREAALAECVRFVRDHDLVVSVLGEQLFKLRVIGLDFGGKVCGEGDWLASSDFDVFVLVTPDITSDSLAESTRWVVVDVVTSSLSVPAMWVSICLSRSESCGRKNSDEFTKHS